MLRMDMAGDLRWQYEYEPRADEPMNAAKPKYG